MSEFHSLATATTTHPSGDARFASLDQTIDHYHHDPTALIQVLHAAQQLFGYLSADVLRYICAELKLPLSQVYGVVTFYHFFSMVPRGKHQILVCTGTTCHVRGSKAILGQLEEHLGVKSGETTRDNLFSLDSARCIGACALAPAMSVDEEVFGRLSHEKMLHVCRHDLKKYV